MLKEKDFVVRLSEKPKPPSFYEETELKADISVFSKEAQPIIEKYLKGGRIKGKEQGMFDRARNEWWYHKYGFSYSNKVARAEVLRRKYAAPKEKTEVYTLQVKLFEAIKNHDQENIDKLKKIYEDKFPEQIEGVTAFFELPKFLETQTRLDKDPNLKAQERQEAIEELTQYQYLLTDFVANNSKNKEFLSSFWEVADETAKNINRLRKVHALRRGVLSQVAIFKVFEALGAKPILSHPKEDAFHAIDLWTDREEVIQIKGSDENTPAIIETDTIAFPGIEVKAEDQIQHFDTFMLRQIQKFRAKVSQYKSMIGKDLKGYMIVVPYTKFDFVTGEPSEDLIEFIKEKIKIQQKGSKELAGSN